MKKFIYSGNKRREISFPLGGIGTGCIGLLGNGALGNFEVRNHPDKYSSAISFFAVKSEQQGKLIDARILQSDNEVSAIESECITNTDHCDNEVCSCCSSSSTVDEFPRFPKCDFISYFPFSELNYSCEKFPADIKLTAFNPFIPLNDTDSGIPGAFFEFDITNTSETELDYTVCSVLESPFVESRNTIGCTENGTAYILMDNSTTLPRDKDGNMCISTDSENISFQEYLFRGSRSEALKMFWNDFTLAPTFVNRSYEDKSQPGGCGVLASHFSLNAGETKKIKFHISWYFPYYSNCFNAIERAAGESEEDYVNKNTERNYYAQYFESSIECASYSFSHWERLKGDTTKFTQSLIGSTLPDSVLEAVTESLCILKSSSFYRLNDGALYSTFEDTLPPLFGLAHLFPRLDRSFTKNFIKQIIDSDNDSDFDIYRSLYVIIKSYQNFKIVGDYEELIESWYDLCKMLDKCFIQNGFCHQESGSESVHEFVQTSLFDTADAQITQLYDNYLLSLQAGLKMARIVGDKKRTELYVNLLDLDKNQVLENLSDLLSDKNRTHEMNYNTAAFMLASGNISEGHKLIGNIKKSCHEEHGVQFSEEKYRCDFETDSTSYALLSIYSGFEYDAYEKHIGFSPLSDNCPLDIGDTFRCFFCVEGAYGYVEEGIDYIEINLIYGKLDIRSFAVPRTPRLVQYGGRNWRFTDKGLCAELDTNLIVTPDKKLTILIDIK